MNKVFRAAHSIKGASGYFGLNKVKELAHRAETVLDMIRSKKMAPNAEITNLLLAAFDKLRDMINHPAESAEADIGELVLNLTGLASSYLPAEKKASLTETVSLNPKGGSPVVVSKFDYESSQESGGLPHTLPVWGYPRVRCKLRGRGHARQSHRKSVAGAVDPGDRIQARRYSFAVSS